MTLTDEELAEWSSQLFEGEGADPEFLTEALDMFLEDQEMQPLVLEHVELENSQGALSLGVEGEPCSTESSAASSGSAQVQCRERAEKTDDEELLRVDEKLREIARIEGKLPRPCVLCRADKVYCDKKFPCTRCVERGCECVIPHTVRKGRPRKSDQGKVTDASQKTAASMQRIAAKKSAIAKKVAKLDARGAEKKDKELLRPVKSKFTPEQLSAVVAMSLWSGPTPTPSASSASCKPPPMPSPPTRPPPLCESEEAGQSQCTTLPSLPLSLPASAPPPSPPTSPPASTTLDVVIDIVGKRDHHLRASDLAIACALTALATLLYFWYCESVVITDKTAAPADAGSSCMLTLITIIASLMPLNYLIFSSSIMPASPERWTRAYAICHFAFALGIVGKCRLMWAKWDVEHATLLLSEHSLVAVDVVSSNETLQEQLFAPPGSAPGSSTLTDGRFDAHRAIFWCMLLFLGGQMLRFAAASVLSPRDFCFWTSLRLMHLWQGVLMCATITLQWWLGLPIMLLMDTDSNLPSAPDARVASALALAASQFACAAVFYPANRQRVAFVIRSAIGIK